MSKHPSSRKTISLHDQLTKPTQPGHLVCG